MSAEQAGLRYEARALHPTDDTKPPVPLDLSRPGEIAQHIAFGSILERRLVGEWEPINLEPQADEPRDSKS